MGPSQSVDRVASYDIVIHIDNVAHLWGEHIDEGFRVVPAVDVSRGKRIVVGVIGWFDRGKTWAVNHIIKASQGQSTIAQDSKTKAVGPNGGDQGGGHLPAGYCARHETKGLSIKGCGSVIILDSAGLDRPVKIKEMKSRMQAEKGKDAPEAGDTSDSWTLQRIGPTSFTRMRQSNIILNEIDATENFVQDFLLDCSDFVLLVLNEQTRHDQAMLENVLQIASIKKQHVIVLHNLRSIGDQKVLEEMWDELKTTIDGEEKTALTVHKHSVKYVMGNRVRHFLLGFEGAGDANILEHNDDVFDLLWRWFQEFDTGTNPLRQKFSDENSFMKNLVQQASERLQDYVSGNQELQYVSSGPNGPRIVLKDREKIKTMEKDMPSLVPPYGQRRDFSEEVCDVQVSHEMVSVSLESRLEKMEAQRKDLQDWYESALTQKDAEIARYKNLHEKDENGVVKEFLIYLELPGMHKYSFDDFLSERQTHYGLRVSGQRHAVVAGRGTQRRDFEANVLVPVSYRNTADDAYLPPRVVDQCDGMYTLAISHIDLRYGSKCETNPANSKRVSREIDPLVLLSTHFSEHNLRLIPVEDGNNSMFCALARAMKDERGKDHKQVRKEIVAYIGGNRVLREKVAENEAARKPALKLLEMVGNQAGNALCLEAAANCYNCSICLHAQANESLSISTFNPEIDSAAVPKKIVLGCVQGSESAQYYASETLSADNARADVWIKHWSNIAQDPESALSSLAVSADLGDLFVFLPHVWPLVAKSVDAQVQEKLIETIWKRGRLGMLLVHFLSAHPEFCADLVVPRTNSSEEQRIMQRTLRFLRNFRLESQNDGSGVSSGIEGREISIAGGIWMPNAKFDDVVLASSYVVEKTYDTAERPQRVAFFDKDKHRVVWLVKKSSQEGTNDLLQCVRAMFFFNLFNSIWRANIPNNSDLALPYVRVLRTICLPGVPYGMLEFVENASPLYRFDNGKGLSLPRNWLADIIPSASGAFVAGYVVELSDRHYDNLMVTDHEPYVLFHIDFGYCFGDAPLLPGGAIPISESFKDSEIWESLVETMCMAYDCLAEKKELLRGLVTLLEIDSSRHPDHSRAIIRMLDKDFRRDVRDATRSWNRRFKNFVHRFEHGPWSGDA